MNHSKKLRPKNVKKINKNEKPLKNMSKPLLITSLVLTVILVTGLLFDQLYEVTLMTIDGKRYQMSDLAYYFYTVESGYNSYNTMLGGDYWDMTYDKKKGTTMRDAAKDDAVDTCERTIILYNEAVKKGYKLTAKEKKTIQSNVKTLLNGKLTDAVIKKNHFTKAYLTKVLSKTTLVERFREDKVKALNIDKDKIKAGIAYKDYRQYNIEYIYAATQKTDEDGKTTELSDKKKEAAFEKISSYYEKAKSADDWSDLIPASETDVTYKETSFLKKDSTDFSDDFKTQIMGMKNGDISEIHKDTKGYYIVRMKNNKATESYDNAVDSAITQAENKAFDKIYAKIKAKHTIKLNKRAIKSLKMGSITLADAD